MGRAGTIASKGGRLLLRIFTVVGALTCSVLLLVGLSLAFHCGAKDKRVESGTVLELRIEGDLAEVTPDDTVAKLMGNRALSLRQLTDALERASHDESVVGLVAYVSDVNPGFARIQELRDAIARFRGQGKFALAFADSFGEMGPANQSYYLATAFDEIWLQPTGSVGLNGLAAEATFFKGTADLLGITVEGGQRREFKNAFNTFTERAYTPAHREAAQALIDDIFAQMVDGIAVGRKLDPATVRATIDRGPFVGPEAFEARLVDGLAYRDEVMDKVEARTDGDPHLLYMSAYLERRGPPSESGRKIALIEGVGNVMRGPSEHNPFSGSTSMGSDTVAKAFADAIADDDIEAIVFRVDSPGGSAVASDTIWRETIRAKEAGKPVIVSMGNLAASGGYYVSAAATKIVAQPATITGSIGVLAIRPVVTEALGKIGVTVDSVQTSENARMFSTTHPYDEAQRQRLETWLDWVYTEFKARVAAGRGMSPEAVEAVAKGRVWSGARAKELGLVDALGGLHEAVQLAKAEAGIGSDEEFQLVPFPRRKHFIEQFFGDEPDSSEDRAAVQLRTGLEPYKPLLQRLEAAQIAGEPGIMMMPLEVGP